MVIAAEVLGSTGRACPQGFQLGPTRRGNGLRALTRTAMHFVRQVNAAYPLVNRIGAFRPQTLSSAQSFPSGVGQVGATRDLDPQWLPPSLRLLSLSSSLRLLSLSSSPTPLRASGTLALLMALRAQRFITPSLLPFAAWRSGGSPQSGRHVLRAPGSMPPVTPAALWRTFHAQTVLRALRAQRLTSVSWPVSDVNADALQWISRRALGSQSVTKKSLWQPEPERQRREQGARSSFVRSIKRYRSTQVTAIAAGRRQDLLTRSQGLIAANRPLSIEERHGDTCAVRPPR